MKLDTLTEHELETIPVFPLPKTVFFPGSLLPLHLFEPRYRAMIRDCLEHGPRVMAIVLLAPGWEGDYEGRPPIHEVATVGRIVEVEERQDGCYDLVLAGMARAALHELSPEDYPYRRASATLLSDRTPHGDAIASLKVSLLSTVGELVERVRQRNPRFSIQIPDDIPPSLLADQLADALVSDATQRQQILEQLDVKVRLALVQDAVASHIRRVTGDKPTLN